MDLFWVHYTQPSCSIECKGNASVGVAERRMMDCVDLLICLRIESITTASVYGSLSMQKPELQWQSYLTEAQTSHAEHFDTHRERHVCIPAQVSHLKRIFQPEKWPHDTIYMRGAI